MNCLSPQLSPGLILTDLCSLPRSLRPSMLSLFCVSQFLLGSNLCCGFLIRLFRHGALLIRRGGHLFRRGAPLIRRGVLLICRGALSAPPWRSPALSAPHWWAPALSAPPWRSAVWLWWSSVLFWWSSAPPWWSSASSAQVWWSSAPPWWSALLQCPVSPFPHGPGPPSLPLFRLRSTALLDCIGASGSRSLWGGSVTNPFHELLFTHHQRSPTHHMDSCTTLHFPSSIALTTRTQLITLITLTPENYHTITITQSHTLYKPWTFSL